MNLQELKQRVIECNWALRDLEYIQKHNRWTEHVTADNIYEWILGQTAELKQIETQYRQELWEQIQVSYRLPQLEREELKKEYEKLLSGELAKDRFIL